MILNKTGANTFNLPIGPLPMRTRRQKRPRDGQRAKLYKAEKEAFNCPALAGKRYESIDAVTKRVNDIWHSKSVASIFKKVGAGKRLSSLRVSVRVEDGRGKRNAYARTDSLACGLPKWARVEWVILHEIAHLVHHRTVSHRNEASHGREYARIYLMLVRRFLGKGAHDALRNSFKKHRVKYTLKRVMSEERKEQLRQQGKRLAAAANGSTNTGVPTWAA